MSPRRQLRAWCLAVLLLLGACNGRMASDPAPTAPPASPSEAIPATSASSNQPTAEPAAAECDGKPCAPPNRCVRYAGIAGPSVPLYACGIPCDGDGACPAAMTCPVIDDGPRLCQ